MFPNPYFVSCHFLCSPLSLFLPYPFSPHSVVLSLSPRDNSYNAMLQLVILVPRPSLDMFLESLGTRLLACWFYLPPSPRTIAYSYTSLSLTKLSQSPPLTYFVLCVKVVCKYSLHQPFCLPQQLTLSYVVHKIARDGIGDIFITKH